MIDTSDMLRKDRMDAYQDGRLSVYMEDIVRRLERLQKDESEEEHASKLLTKRKQEIWDNQYLIHYGQLQERKGRYEACLLYTSPSPRDRQKSRMPSSA